MGVNLCGESYSLARGELTRNRMQRFGALRTACEIRRRIACVAPVAGHRVRCAERPGLSTMVGS
ncbi:hypothetical protein BURMUCF1_1000 [Burkholderia multivorans ATCC BAA-247]|nr:hypothetical protein BURMUCF1_1000 [Burkholderia multivorans ATCC BAA-247]